MNDKIKITRLLQESMTKFDADSLVDAVLLVSRDGSLPPGTRLPTIAALAEALSISSSTVSRAWGNLRQMGAIETRRRGGSTIAHPVQPTAYRSAGTHEGNFKYSLAAGYPDPSLQIDLSRILSIVAQRGEFLGYPGKDHISESLRASLIKRIGYEPHALMLETDVLGTIPRVLQAVSHRGSEVGIGDPDFPLYSIILRQGGLTPVPIPFDTGGYDLDIVAKYLSSGVRVLLLQTRVHNPTGLAVPTENLEAIAQLLRTHDATAIEIDHHGELVPQNAERLGGFAPERVVLLSSFSKDVHPDVRVGCVAGPATVLDRVSVWRAGGGWVSSINKAVLDVCLNDPRVHVGIRLAREEYARRRIIFQDRFIDAGVDIESNAGLSLWIPVRSEQDALVSLAAQGISVARGSAFSKKTSGRDHIHLSLGSVGADSVVLSAAILHAALIEPGSVGRGFL
ncbi:aminotransferase class I/II-fold pyridoxal phosphate-dependent enzyme [Homoserinimonas sp. OAct 916]|uniref:aminotransferase class I/II-fold pyridoxal phosphate-dependent enzyme n=1 Tax=Homoserinimonas sp. OAct 916 TaxID=2211450 RepID=UPI000DBE2B1D|nr:aminotransferase class I/II-fold pyridoxal phosphate-dependent enzyme [Homoserinimonas sp. OAct 916]